jgi:hypothetical protein
LSETPPSEWPSRATLNGTPPREWPSRARFSETGSWTPSQRIWSAAGQRRAAGPGSVRRDNRGQGTGCRTFVSAEPAPRRGTPRPAPTPHAATHRRHRTRPHCPGTRRPHPATPTSGIGTRTFAQLRLPKTGRGWQAARPCRCQPPPWCGSVGSGPSCTPAAPAAPMRCSSWATRCCAPRGPVAAAPEPGAGLPARLGSAYAALARGRIDTERLRDLLASSLPDADPLVFAVEATTWPRCDAECSPERGYYYHPRGIRLASRSSPAGPTSRSPSSASSATPGPPRSTPGGYTRWRTLTGLPQARSARCLSGWTSAGGCRCSSSTAATTPPSCPWTSPRRPWRYWCGYGRTAASTPTRHHAYPAGVDVHVATAPGSTAPTRPPGRPRPPPTPPPTTSTAPSPSRAWSGLHPKQQRHPGHGSGGPAGPSGLAGRTPRPSEDGGRYTVESRSLASSGSSVPPLTGVWGEEAVLP